MRARGIDLAVHETGSGTTLVRGHGLLGSIAQEDDAGLIDWPELAGRHRVVRFDARGHGGSEATLDPGSYCWPELARDTLAVIDRLAEGPAVLGGLSMGCATALHAALTAPDRVAGLVLIAPPTAWSTRPRQALTYRLLALVLDWIGMAPLRLLTSLPRANPGESARARLERSVVDHLGRADARAIVGALRGAALSDLPPREALAGLDIPVSILAWPDDPSHPMSTARRLADTLPHAELKVARTVEEVRAWAGSAFDSVAAASASLAARDA